MMKLAIATFLSFFVALPVIGQMSRGDSILINETAIQRPLTLHKNQFRLTLGYDFFIYNSMFNEDGSKTQLSGLGIAASHNEIPIQFQYGISEFIEISAGLFHASRNLRNEQIVLISTLERPLSINEFNYVTGFSDIQINLNGRVPFNTRKFDLMFSVGGDLAVAKNEPDLPGHTVRSTVIIDTVDEIQYNHYNHWGNGTMVYQAGGWFKYRFDRAGLNLVAYYRTPSGISESIKWNYRMIDYTGFEYLSETYRYQIDKELFINAYGEYLLFPWFDVLCSIRYAGMSGGWSEITGKRIANNDRNELLFVPGFEILATHRFWIRQQMTLPLSGKNTLASTSFEFRLIYNFFMEK